MAELDDLLTKKAELDAAIAKAREIKRDDYVARVRALIEEGGLKPEDVFPSTKKRGPTPPKYRDEVGRTWTGRGKRPVWLREALLAGRTLESFAIKQ